MTSHMYIKPNNACT